MSVIDYSKSNILISFMPWMFIGSGFIIIIFYLLVLILFYN